MTEGTLLQDYYGFKKDLYGLRGDKVKIFSVHGDVFLVEGVKRVEGEENKKKVWVKSGAHKYPVHKDLIDIKK